MWFFIKKPDYFLEQEVGLIIDYLSRMDVDKVNNQMQNLAFGEALLAAAEDYKQVSSIQ